MPKSAKARQIESKNRRFQQLGVLCTSMAENGDSNAH